MTTSHLPSDLHESATAQPVTHDRNRGWLWIGLVASVLGLVSTSMVQGTPEPAAFDQGSEAVLNQLEGRVLLQVGASLACVSAFLLVPFFVGLIAHLRRATPAGSPSAELLRAGSTALVAALMITTSLRYVATGGLQGGIAAAYYTVTDSTAMVMLGSQLQYAGWLPGLIVTGVVAHAALRHGLVARWAGAVIGPADRALRWRDAGGRASPQCGRRCGGCPARAVRRPAHRSSRPPRVSSRRARVLLATTALAVGSTGPDWSPGQELGGADPERLLELLAPPSS